MPKCMGRPDGICPDNKCDRTVKNSQGDLMLCAACEHFRFPYIKKSSSTSNMPTTNLPTDATRPEPIIINEALAYIAFYRNKSNVDALRRVVLSSFQRQRSVWSLGFSSKLVHHSYLLKGEILLPVLYTRQTAETDDYNWSVGHIGSPLYRTYASLSQFCLWINSIEIWETGLLLRADLM